MNYVLASGSPRRIELLRSIGLEFEIMKSDIEEYVNVEAQGADFALELSRLKVTDIASKLNEQEEYLIIGADTIVKLGDKILEKPKDRFEAESMLIQLSGKCHEVITGVTLMHMPSKKILSSYEKTLVFFKNLTHNEIMAYISKGEYKDKAGAYGIQEFGSLLVERIEGCYFNVVGLPLTKLNSMLNEFDINILLSKK